MIAREGILAAAELPAGRELDLAIAAIIDADFCLARLRTDTNRFAQPLWCRRCQEDAVGVRLPGEYHKPPRPYSTDIAAAWELHKTLKTKGARLELKELPSGQWRATFLPEGTTVDILLDAYAPTAPLAISHAALKFIADTKGAP